MVRTIGLGIISWLALAGFVGLCALAAAHLSDAVFKTRLMRRIAAYTKGRAYTFGFTLSLIATFASLFLSEILHFQPCILCWYQRIAMYPQTLLFYIALIRNERSITPYIMALNVIGIAVSLYHYSLHILPRTVIPLVPCAKEVGGVPCDKGYDLYFGFMSFPLMAFVVFALILYVMRTSVVRTRQKIHA